MVAHLRTYEDFLQWEELHTRKIMKTMTGPYYTEIGYTPENTKRAVFLPDRWWLDMNTIRGEIEREEIPVIPGWCNIGSSKSGQPRIRGMLFVSDDFVSEREKAVPQLEANARIWEALHAKLEFYRQQCAGAAEFYHTLPPSLSPEMNLPRASSCPFVQRVRLNSRKIAEAPTSKVVPDAERWEKSVEACFKAAAHVAETGGAWNKTNQSGVNDFSVLIGKLYTGKGSVHSVVEELAWKYLVGQFKAGAGNKIKKQTL